MTTLYVGKVITELWGDVIIILRRTERAPVVILKIGQECKKVW